MNKLVKKGFTLIELLAVLIIIGIISVITIPIVLSSIETSKTKAFLSSTENIIKASDLKYAETFSGPYQIIYEAGVVTSTDTLAITGKKPDDAIINIDETGAISFAIWDGNLKKCALKDYSNDEIALESVSNKEDCMALAPTIIVEVYKQVIDTNPGIICGSGIVEDYAGNTNCNINSVEDLVKLSQLVKTNNFSGKTVNLNDNLDIENPLSYINSTTTALGDINGNSIVETLLVEMTTARGFEPIGSGTAPFSGIFNGNAKIINNLYINRPSSNYVGFFGQLAGIAKGLTIDNAYVAGSSYVAVLAGNLTGGITSANINGDVVASGSYAAILVGLKSNTVATNSSVVSGNVSGADYISGAISYIANSSNLSSIIYKSGSVSGTGTFIRRMSTYNAIPNAISNKNILVNGVIVASNAFHGNDIDSTYLNDINVYETLGLDTYIGGDNDADGYYFDYDNDGNLAVTANTAIVSLAGSGTLIDPYLISNYSDLKKVSKNPTANYKLLNNIDLSSKKAYMMGSNTNRFTGTFDGNGKELIGYKINGYDYSSIFGYLSGTVKGLKIIDAEITGSNYTAILAGLLNGSVTSTYVEGTIVSRGSYVALLGGQRTGSGIIGNNIVEGSVNGIDYVSGVISYLSTATNVGPHVYLNGSVSGTGTYVRRVSTFNAMNIALANPNILVNGAPIASGPFHGADRTLSLLGDINIYETSGFDTIVGGDNDGDGYAFDYNETGEITIVKYDSSITMAGIGTVGDPYLISNYSELKQASKNTTAHYKLLNNIDLTSQKAYVLGSNANRFSGTFDGNGKSIIGITINGDSYTSMFGYLSGTVKGLNIINATINSFNNYAGIISGFCDNCSVNENYISGNVTSNYDYVGLIIGLRGGTGLVGHNVVEGNVIGRSYIGGLIPYLAGTTNTTAMVYKSGSVIGTGSYVHKISAYNAIGNIYASQSILVNGAITGSGGFDGTSVTDASLLLQATYNSYGFNFTDTTPGTYIWKISGSNIWVEKN